jgi:DNA-binding winged helix-turn-helix (wHTH) protein
MRQRLWASGSLNTAIKKLRSALGDTPENSRYIETVPRVDYMAGQYILKQAKAEYAKLL